MAFFNSEEFYDNTDNPIEIAEPESDGFDLIYFDAVLNAFEAVKSKLVASMVFCVLGDMTRDNFMLLGLGKYNDTKRLYNQEKERFLDIHILLINYLYTLLPAKMRALVTLGTFEWYVHRFSNYNPNCELLC